MEIQRLDWSVPDSRQGVWHGSLDALVWPKRPSLGWSRLDSRAYDQLEGFHQALTPRWLCGHAQAARRDIQGGETSRNAIEMRGCGYALRWLRGFYTLAAPAQA